MHRSVNTNKPLICLVQLYLKRPKFWICKNMFSPSNHAESVKVTKDPNGGRCPATFKGRLITIHEKSNSWLLSADSLWDVYLTISISYTPLN